MSPSVDAGSLPVHRCTASHVHTCCTHMCMVLTRWCLLPVGIEGRRHHRSPIWRQAQRQQGVFLECRSKPFDAWRPAHGAFVTSFAVPLGRGHALLLHTDWSCSPLLKPGGACLPACFVYLLLRFCVAALDPPPTTVRTVHCLPFRLPPQSMPSRTSGTRLPQR